MIWESHYWKEDLVRLASRLEQRQKQLRWPPRSLTKFEKEVFIGCHSIRKLIEAKKLSDRIMTGKVSAQCFRFIGGRRPTIFNWSRKFIDAYDFTKPKNISMSTIFLCNQVIHSYVFIPVFNDSNVLDGVFVNSDRLRGTHLYYLRLKTFISLFLRAGRDYPTRLEAAFNEQAGDYIIKNS